MYSIYPRYKSQLGIIFQSKLKGRTVKKIIIAISVFVLIVGCTTNKPALKQQEVIGKFGKKPILTKSMKNTIAKDIKKMLRDPYSAKIKVFPYVKKGTYLNIAGWVAITSVNAKNAYGAYVGNTGFASFLIINQKTGKIASIMHTEKIDNNMKIKRF